MENLLYLLIWATIVHASIIYNDRNIKSSHLKGKDRAYYSCKIMIRMHKKFKKHLWEDQYQERVEELSGIYDDIFKHLKGRWIRNKIKPTFIQEAFMEYAADFDALWNSHRFLKDLKVEDVEYEEWVLVRSIKTMQAFLKTIEQESNRRELNIA